MNNLVEDIKIELDKEEKKDNIKCKLNNNIYNKHIENKNNKIEGELESNEATEGILDY